MNVCVLLLFGVLCIVGVAFVVTYINNLISNLRLLFIKPDWQKVNGTILHSSAEVITIPGIYMQFPDYDVIKTYVELRYMYAGINKNINIEISNDYLAYRIDEAKNYMATQYPPENEIPVFINGKDVSEIVIEERKLKRKKITIAVKTLVYLVLFATGLAILGLGIFGVITQIQKGIA